MQIFYNKEKKIFLVIGIRMECNIIPILRIEYVSAKTIGEINIKCIERYNNKPYELRKDEIKILKVLEKSNEFLEKYLKFKNSTLTFFETYCDTDLATFKYRTNKLFKNIEKYFSDEIKLRLEIENV